MANREGETGEDSALNAFLGAVFSNDEEDSDTEKEIMEVVERLSAKKPRQSTLLAHTQKKKPTKITFPFAANAAGASSSSAVPNDSDEKEIKGTARKPTRSRSTLHFAVNAAATSLSLANANRPSREYQLLMAIFKGEWDAQDGVKNILESGLAESPLCDYFKHPLTKVGETALHMAVQAQAGKNNAFLKNVLDMYVSQGVELTTLRDFLGRTPLHLAAEVGDLAASQLFVERDERLLLVEATTDGFPIYEVAASGRRELLAYYLEQTRRVADISYFESEIGIELMVLLVQAGLHDIAYQILKEFPSLARKLGSQAKTIIFFLATNRRAFYSGRNFSFWERITYSWVSIESEKPEQSNSVGDVENPNNQAGQSSRFSSQLTHVWRKLVTLMWNIGFLVPTIKRVRDRKIVHHHALKLTKLVCSDIYNMHYAIVTVAMQLAAKAGIHEIVEEMLRVYPAAIYHVSTDGYTIFQEAVRYRHVNVYNLMFQMGNFKDKMLKLKVRPWGTLLHFAARLPPQERLNVVSGAALQMQRELQWFKAVEKVMPPAYLDWEDGPSPKDSDPLLPNWKPRTPSVLFAEEHRELVKEGEKWMKDTATSCTIAAVLIATVVFAASITVPGGNNSNGSPIFTNDKAFIAFAIADAIALYSSVASVIMFLSILTSRYTQEDFLHSLPQKLIIGLLTLFLSMTSMMGAFSAAMYLVFGNQNAWTLAIVGAFACLPVSLFVFSQFPLLVEMIRSTYGGSIFCKQSDQIIF